MNDKLEQQLLESLELLDQGLTLEQVLARNPEDAAELRPFLETAAQVSRLALQPPIAAKQASRRAFLNDAAAMREAQQKPSPLGWLRRGLLPLAGLAAIVLLFAVGLVTASTTAMPGDALYQTKRAGEAVRLALVRDPERRAAFLNEQQQERLREVEALLRAGREAQVTFDGLVERDGTAEWMVSGIAVAIGPETNIEGMPHRGDLVRVDGVTRDGAVAADRISLIAAALPTPTPDVAPTLEALVPVPATTEAPASTVPPTATLRPSVTPDDTPTLAAPADPTAEPTRAVPPTVEANPVPNPTPTDDNGGQNGNDDDNQNNNNGDDNGNDQDNGDGGGQDNNSNDNSDDNSGNDNNDDSGDNNGNGGNDGENNGNDNAGEDGNNNDQNNGNDHGGDNGSDNSNNSGHGSEGGD